MDQPAQHVLLVGINYYLPNQRSGGSYHNLRGCVPDVLRAEAFLRERLHVPSSQICKLLATVPPQGSEPVEPPEQRPTYVNIVSALRQLGDTAQPGDHVYFHYSGHGGRAATRWKALKGGLALDEVLVPMDIGVPDGRYLRDVELAHLICRMVDRGIRVTVVLDSCHAGDATRSLAQEQFRSGGFVDLSPWSETPSLAGTDQELVATWRRGGTRSSELGSGWLPEPEGYVLLAACRAAEKAVEAVFEGTECRGALSYFLYDALSRHQSVTYRQLHGWILGSICSRYRHQTPVLEGDGDRLLFGHAVTTTPHAINVLSVDEIAGRVWLNAGRAHGLHQGCILAIYPLGTADFTQAAARLALVKLVELGATQSWAQFGERLAVGAISAGAQAIVIAVSATPLIRTVRLEAGAAEIWGPFRRALATQSAGDIQEAMADGPADYRLRIRDRGEYELCDPQGTPLPNLALGRHRDGEGAAAQVVETLQHLSRYHRLLELANQDGASALAGKLIVKLKPVRGYAEGDPPAPPAGDGQSAIAVSDGDWAFLCIRNAATQTELVLNFVVLDLQPDWGVSQLYPPVTAFRSLDPGQEETLPVRFYLPPELDDGTDFLKVIATLGPADFRWLELPPLGSTPSLQRGARGTLPALAGSHHATTWALPSQQWTTATVTVRVKRS